MKKFVLTLVMTLIVVAANAMSYEEAREQARFLTDKMAYELNLNDAQYNDCYEINLDYLMSIQTADDVYGPYLSYRNADIRHILYDWQYALFAAADYFFHPVYWHRTAWVFPIYRHYSVGHFYYAHPRVFFDYRGGHGRYYHRTGFYVFRRPHWNGGFRGEHRGPIGRTVAHHPHGGHHGSVSTSIHTGRGYHFESGYTGSRRGGVGSHGSGSVSTQRPEGRSSSTGFNGHSSVVGSSERSSVATPSSPSSVGRSGSYSSVGRSGGYSGIRRGSSSSYQHPSSTRSTGASVSRGSTTRSASSSGSRSAAGSSSRGGGGRGR